MPTVRHIDQSEQFVSDFLYPLVCNTVIGIESPEQFAFAVSVAPNPNNGNFTVQLPNEKGNYYLRLFDAAGRCLAQYVQPDGGQIDLQQSLPQGAYWLQITHAKGSVTKTLVVQP
ncbi:MAG: T9SS type A sorting domain-containing protein [Sphingobacteriales bacterium]|nr:T9SS type A sorting domain-containing protein [Sphingobacteriales bacterium]